MRLGRDQRSRTGKCGLCGRVKQLSNTHVPPQCAGNTGNVQRFVVMADTTGRAASGSKKVGGIHFYGLCIRCNTLVQGRWDSAYCELARQLWRFAVGSSLILPRVIEMPSNWISPGKVARFVLSSAFALDPGLRTLYEDVADELISDAESISLPSTVRLRMAVTPGPMARVTGAMTGFFLFGARVNDQPIGISAFAQIYFPPLAWQVQSGPSALLDIQGWADVSDWLQIAPSERLPLRDLCPTLPQVLHPHQNPNETDRWSEMFADEICFIVESENALPTNWIKMPE